MMPEEKEFDEKVDIRIWKKLFRYAFRFKKILFASMAMMIVVAGIDIAYPLMSKYAIDSFIVPGTTQGLPLFILVYFLMVAIQGALVFGFITLSGKLEMNISYDIRKDGFVKLQELSFSFFDRTPVGYLLARMVSDVARLSEMLSWSFTDVVWALAYMFGCIGVLFTLNASLALVVLVIVPFLAVCCLYFQKRILKQQRVVRKCNSKITGAFNEGIMGAMTTKTLVRERANAEEFSQITGDMKRASVRSAVLSATFMPLVMLLGSVGTALAITSGGSLVAAGAMGLGTLAAFISYSTQLFDPIQSLARILAEFQSAQASAERVISLIDTPCEITDSDEVTAVYGDSFAPKRENWPEIAGGVEFKNVSFAYKNGERVLENFSLKVEPGETVALVGETGAGKSTIVNLVCRFYEPTEGSVLIDGVDYRERSQLWLEESLGYVLQTPHLFSGTIEDNIKYADSSASREQVRAAARMVHADSFIEKLPDGYDTQVGEGGALLSTGQKQLISFARVILADPRIFVLDEATSSIDTETEQLIQNAITRVLDGRTSFIVAHRLSTIRGADRILVIRDGRITEQGSHRELMAQRGYYYNLYTNQFRDERSGEELAGKRADRG